MVLLIFVSPPLETVLIHLNNLKVSVSSPTWQSVSFLHVGSGSSTVRYGVFGFTGHSPSVGYRFQLAPHLIQKVKV